MPGSFFTTIRPHINRMPSLLKSQNAEWRLYFSRLIVSSVSVVWHCWFQHGRHLSHTFDVSANAPVHHEAEKEVICFSTEQMQVIHMCILHTLQIDQVHIRYFRMSVDRFDNLLYRVGARITYTGTHLMPVTPAEQL